MMSYALDGWLAERDAGRRALADMPVLMVSAMVRGGEEQVFPEGDDLWDRFMRKPSRPTTWCAPGRISGASNREVA